jgi:hypothetical protein
MQRIATEEDTRNITSGRVVGHQVHGDAAPQGMTSQKDSVRIKKRVPGKEHVRKGVQQHLLTIRGPTPAARSVGKEKAEH